jgi:hypothetical protein
LIQPVSSGQPVIEVAGQAACVAGERRNIVPVPCIV